MEASSFIFDQLALAKTYVLCGFFLEYDVAVHKYSTIVVRDARDGCNGLHERWSIRDVEDKDAVLASWFLLHLQ